MAQAEPGFSFDVNAVDLENEGKTCASVSLAYVDDVEDTRDRLQRVWRVLEQDVLPQCATCDYAYIDFENVGASLRQLACVLAFLVDYAPPESEGAGQYCMAPCNPVVLFRLTDKRSTVAARHTLLLRAEADPCFRHMVERATYLVSTGQLNGRGNFDPAADRGADDSDSGAASETDAVDPEFASLAYLCASGQRFVGLSSKQQLEVARTDSCKLVSDALTARSTVRDAAINMPFQLFLRRPPVDGAVVDRYRARCNGR